MSTEREELEKKKKEQAKENRNKNLLKAGSIVLGAIGVIWGMNKNKS